MGEYLTFTSPKLLFAGLALDSGIFKGCFKTIAKKCVTKKFAKLLITIKTLKIQNLFFDFTQRYHKNIKDMKSFL
jgi:hypothetical protein